MVKKLNIITPSFSQVFHKSAVHFPLPSAFWAAIWGEFDFKYWDKSCDIQSCWCWNFSHVLKHMRNFVHQLKQILQLLITWNLFQTSYKLHG